jgi:hypothetical protein
MYRLKSMTYIEQRRQFILSGRPLPEKKKYFIPKISKKKKEQLKKQAESGSDNEMDLWFEARRKEMTGKCCLCGGKTLKNDDENYRRSIHHLLDKRKNMFPSVATHEDNWLELCFWGNSCHSNIHNGTITWDLLKDSQEWSIIVSKFIKIFPYIHPEERKNIPEQLLQNL